MSILDVCKKNMSRVENKLKEELRQIRVGKANGDMVANISVDIYGSCMSLQSVASITVPELRQILITPFDGNSIGNVKKALDNAGFSPMIDGNAVRVVIPAPTGEDRKKYVKTVKEKGEDAKIKMRNERQDKNRELKNNEKEKIISQDEVKKFEKQIQGITNDYCKRVDAIIAEKEKEIINM